MGVRWRNYYYLLLAYLPGLFLPLILTYSEKNADYETAWLYMFSWVIYVFLLLITAHLTTGKQEVEQA